MVSKFCSAFNVEAWADDVDTVRFTTDWEDDFDAVGIAKCCQCGLRLPVDHESIEHHSRSCTHAVDGEAPRMELPKAKEWLENPWRLRNSDAETTCYSSGLEEDASGVSCDRELTGTDDAAAAPCVSYDQATDDEDESPRNLQDMGIEDWEDGFDAIGIGKCSHCGSKLPLDDEAIDQHLRECKARAADSAGEPEPQFGTCCRCQQRISLDPEAVIAHSQMCLSHSVSLPPQQQASAKPPECSTGRPLALAAGCFSANASLFGTPPPSGSDILLNRCMDVADESSADAGSILSSWASWRKPWQRQQL